MHNIDRYRPFKLSLVLLYVFALTTSIMHYAPDRVIVVFSLLSIIAILNFKAFNFSKISFLIIAITFPVTLKFFEKDAFSTGTLVIFITLALSLLKNKLSVTLTKDKFIINTLVLIVSTAVVGVFTKTPSTHWGPAARHLLDLISSIAAFILIIQLQSIQGIAESNKQYIEKVINVLLIITVFHIYLSLIIINVPWIEKFLVVFFDRTQDHLGSYDHEGIFMRATTIFTGGEEFGELLILLFPFSLFKLFSNKSKLNYFLSASLLLGTLFSGTRSAFILICFQILIYVYIIVPKVYIKKKIIVTAFLIVISTTMGFIFSKFTPILLDRIKVTIETVKMRENISTIVNRDEVWQQAFNVTIDTISIFGHGPIQAGNLGFPAKNFHNLYLSLLFQFGLMGFFIFLILFFAIANRLVKNSKKMLNNGSTYLLSVSCLLSFLCFLINEFKYEFNRSDSYQQLVWIFFSIFYLTGKLRKNKHAEKTTGHQSESIRVSY